MHHIIVWSLDTLVWLDTNRNDFFVYDHAWTRIYNIVLLYVIAIWSLYIIISYKINNKKYWPWGDSKPDIYARCLHLLARVILLHSFQKPEKQLYHSALNYRYIVHDVL